MADVMTANDAERAADVMREFERLQSIRYNWESLWADIARRIHPNANVFQRSLLGVSQAERRMEYIFDSTPVQALESFAAIVTMLETPPTQQWAGLVPSDEKLTDNVRMKQALEDVNQCMFEFRQRPEANFYSQAEETRKDLGAFGTRSMFTDEAITENVWHLRYRAVPLQDLYFGQNPNGLIDRVFRKYAYSAQQACDEWGENALPDAIKSALHSDKHREFEFLHAVRPRKEPEYGRADYRGMLYESIDLLISPKTIIKESGYRTIPYATSRYTIAPREVYGRSPGLLCLSDAKMLMEMSRLDINAVELMTFPPILVGGEASGGFNLRAGALNYDMISNDGKPMAQPFGIGSQPEITEERMQKRREMIEQAFLSGPYSIMRLIIDHPDMTATAILHLAQERGALLTPIMGRQQSEFLGVLIRREFNLLFHAGKLPPLPDELLNQQTGKFDLKVEYTSPLAKLQRAQDGVAISRTFEQLVPLAESTGRQDMFRAFDLAKVGRELADINGVPAKLMLTPEDEEAAAQQEAQQAQVQALIQAAPQAASAAKDLAQAHSIATNVPQTEGQ